MHFQLQILSKKSLFRRPVTLHELVHRTWPLNRHTYVNNLYEMKLYPLKRSLSCPLRHSTDFEPIMNQEANHFCPWTENDWSILKKKGLDWISLKTKKWACATSASFKKCDISYFFWQQKPCFLPWNPVLSHWYETRLRKKSCPDSCLKLKNPVPDTDTTGCWLSTAEPRYLPFS